MFDKVNNVNDKTFTFLTFDIPTVNPVHRYGLSITELSVLEITP